MIEGSVIRNHQSEDAGAIPRDSQHDQDFGQKTWESIENTKELDKAVDAVLNGELERAEIEVKWADRWHKVLLYDNGIELQHD